MLKKNWLKLKPIPKCLKKKRQKLKINLNKLSKPPKKHYWLKKILLSLKLKWRKKCQLHRKKIINCKEKVELLRQPKKLNRKPLKNKEKKKLKKKPRKYLRRRSKMIRKMLLKKKPN